MRRAPSTSNSRATYKGLALFPLCHRRRFSARRLASFATDGAARACLAAAAAARQCAPDRDGSFEIIRHDRGYVVSFDANGVRFAAFDAGTAPEWTWSLALTACRRDTGAGGLAPAEPALVADRVGLWRGDGVDWYRNRRSGIEQGFTVAGRTEGEGPFALTLVFGGALVVDPPVTLTSSLYDSDQANAWLGYSVAVAGEVNADGFDDVAIGSHLADNGQADEGRVFAFRGSTVGLGAAEAWIVENNQAAAQLGWSVACGGDVNGDGFSDVIVGLYQLDAGHSKVGRAIVFYGTPCTTPSQTASYGVGKA